MGFKEAPRLSFTGLQRKLSFDADLSVFRFRLWLLCLHMTFQ